MTGTRLMAAACLINGNREVVRNRHWEGLRFSVVTMNVHASLKTIPIFVVGVPDSFHHSL